jgi:hypothetical protein
MEVYAEPALGGVVNLDKTSPNFTQERYDFLINTLDDAGVVYTVDDDGSKVTLTIPEKTFYVGQPTRLNGFIKEFVAHEFYSKPTVSVIQDKDGSGSEIFPEVVITAAEAYFLRAEASLLGFNAGATAESLFQNGIRRSMDMWGVSAESYIANESMAKLDGTTEENLEKVYVQRWIAAYTDGFEAWAVVRKHGYPSRLAQGVSNNAIFGMGDINGAYPLRLQYGSAAYSKNGERLAEAIARQGADRQDTKLWWEK